MNKIISSSVAILLSTYNGERYLEEQVLSILSQDYRDFTLFIRDDGSSDNTKNILDKIKETDERIVIVESNENLGPSSSFLRLAYMVDADFYFFCDQDDIWLENKVSDTLYEMSKLNQDKPCLVHTDLTIVDKDLNIISKSFYEHSSLNIELARKKKQILFQNFVVGCTSCINRKMLDVASIELEQQQFIAMHDWWFTLHAIFFGEISFVNKSTILYRQHEGNVLGSKGNGIIRYIISGVSGKGFVRAKKFRYKVFRQVELFKLAKKNVLSDEDLELINEFDALSEKATIFTLFRFVFIKKHSLQSFKRNVAFCLSVF